MPLLADYVITPDVFDISAYSGDEACGLHLQLVKEVLLSEGLVRDLRNGEWHALFSNGNRQWHQRAKELLKKLATQGRLRRFQPCRGESPTSDAEWCAEALESNAVAPLIGGVIVTERVKVAYPEEQLVARIDKLLTTPWWIARSNSVSVTRCMDDYRNHLNPILRFANAIMFVDPHLDPARSGYQEFPALIASAARPSVAPTIEIHRVCYEGSGPSREILDAEEIERRFRNRLDAAVRGASLRVEVFVWDDFHDRFVISDLVGISVPNGFDTTTNPNDITRWTRLGRADRDDVQREFDPASDRHKLRHRFMLG